VVPTAIHPHRTQWSIQAKGHKLSLLRIVLLIVFSDSLGVKCGGVWYESKNMKFLICGLGSIGLRHLHNLRSLGEKDIIAYRSRNLPVKDLPKDVPMYTDLDTALDQKPAAAFVTNPTNLHISTARTLAAHGCHLFIEKPLGTNITGVRELKKIALDNHLIVYPGFMMRFHPAVTQIKKWLTEGKIGPPISARFSCGSYLPSWHPWEDYRNGYAADKKQSGGLAFTMAHEIDIITWFFGMPDSLYALTSRKSPLEISVEHSMEILFQYKNKFLAELHLDFLQMPPQRTWEIIGNEGKIEFDAEANILNIFKVDRKTDSFKKTTVNYTSTFRKNDMYMKELADFLSSVKDGKKPEITFSDGMNNLEILVIIDESLKKNKPVSVLGVRPRLNRGSDPLCRTDMLKLLSDAA
jgi:predicted dehydrogenase